MYDKNTLNINGTKFKRSSMRLGGFLRKMVFRALLLSLLGIHSAGHYQMKKIKLEMKC
jgi:hypothetical protein